MFSILGALQTEKGQKAEEVTILDVASGPDMLKRHIPEKYTDRVISLDINPHHFVEGKGRRVVGSFVNLPIADKSIDYVNLSLGWHYTNFVPSKQKLERLQVLQELNRVLPEGGRAAITMIYSLDLKDASAFTTSVEKLGFKVIPEYSGESSNGNNFAGRVLTLEKVADSSVDIETLAQDIGVEGLQAFKFKKDPVSLKDVRKIATHFKIGETALEANLNPTDQESLDEETRVLEAMDAMKRRFGSIADIPKGQLLEHGLSRIWNGKRYVLFKKLDIGSGAVVIR